jgi:hypothetical protein
MLIVRTFITFRFLMKISEVNTYGIPEKRDSDTKEPRLGI